MPSPVTAALLASLLLFGCGSSQSATIASPDQFAGPPVTVNVCGFTPMNPTGVKAQRGERWFIEVTGSTATCADGSHGHPDLHDCDRPDCAMWRDGGETTTPEGWELWYLKPFFFLKRVRSARWYELTGSIGPDLHQTFVIGRSRTVTIKEDGDIYLFANDAASRYDNNYGSLRVRLVRLK